MVGQAGQVANLEAVQGQCVMEIYLLCTIKDIDWAFLFLRSN